MNAREAKQLANDANNVDITLILDKIELVAKRGEYTTQFNVHDKNTIQIKSIIAKLKEMDYTVEHIHGTDQRDRETWNYLVISWN